METKFSLAVESESCTIRKNILRKENEMETSIQVYVCTYASNSYKLIMQVKKKKNSHIVEEVCFSSAAVKRLIESESNELD